MSNPNFRISVTMPEQYCPADAEWIHGRLEQLSVSMRNRTAYQYAGGYTKYYEAEPVSFRKENVARHKANTWLREYVEKHADAAAGLTEKPPLASTRAQAGHAVEIGNDQQDSGARYDSMVSGDVSPGNVSLASEKVVRFSQGQNPQKAGQVQRPFESSNHQAPE